MNRIVGAILALVMLASLATPSLDAEAGTPPGRYIVHTEGGAVNEAARQGMAAHGGITLKELASGSGLVVLVPDRAIGLLGRIPGVAAVEPDVVLNAAKGPPAERASLKTSHPSWSRPFPGGWTALTLNWPWISLSATGWISPS